jgi:uncharacterized protein (TIGR03435 family)
MRLMMQALLAERFHLAVHFETREGPVFAMTFAKPGTPRPGIRPHAEGASCDEPAGPNVFPPICDVMSASRRGPGQMLSGSRNTTMTLVAPFLGAIGHLDRPVIDQTGLTGRVDFKLRWTDDSTEPPPGAVLIRKTGPPGAAANRRAGAGGGMARRFRNLPRTRSWSGVQCFESLQSGEPKYVTIAEFRNRREHDQQCSRSRSTWSILSAI